MSTACALALLLVASAPPQTEAPVDKDTPVRCDAERATCRDGCTLEYGTSMFTRDKIATCLDQCDERRDICLLRIIAKQRVAPPAPRRKDAQEPAKRPDPSQPSTPYTLPPTEYSRTPVRADDMPQDELPPAHRTATSTSELGDGAPPASPNPPAPPTAGRSDSTSDAPPARAPKKKGKPRKSADAP